MRESPLEQVRPFGYALIALIFVAMILRSYHDFTDPRVLFNITGGVLLAVFLFGYLYVSRVSNRFSTQQEGVIILFVSLLSLLVTIALSLTNAKSVPRDAYFTFAAFFVFGLGHIVGPYLPVRPQRSIGVVGVLMGFGLFGFSVKLFQSGSTVIAADNAIFGIALIIVALLMMVKPDGIISD